MDTLPQFPTDDATLLALEHALGGYYTVIDDELVLQGADYNLDTLLKFLSGYDEKYEQIEDDGSEGIISITYPYMVYGTSSVIAALVCEVRRLREEISNG